MDCTLWMKWSREKEFSGRHFSTTIVTLNVRFNLAKSNLGRRYFKHLIHLCSQLSEIYSMQAQFALKSLVNPFSTRISDIQQMRPQEQRLS